MCYLSNVIILHSHCVRVIHAGSPVHLSKAALELQSQLFFEFFLKMITFNHTYFFLYWMISESRKKCNCDRIYFEKFSNLEFFLKLRKFLINIISMRKFSGAEKFCNNASGRCWTELKLSSSKLGVIMRPGTGCPSICIIFSHGRILEIK